MALEFCRYCDIVEERKFCESTDADICRPCKKLFELDEKVKEIKTILIGLERERWELKSQMNEHHDRFIHRLPSEIASEIFTFCLPGYFFALDFQDFPSKRTLEMPLVISSVCKGWRDITHSTPQLWTMPPLISKQSFAKLPFIQRWIDRSGELPLSIVMRLKQKSEVNVVKVIGLLNQYSMRWLELHYEGNASLCCHFSSNVPNLRTLHLYDTSGLISFRSPIKMSAKQLQVLSLYYIRLQNSATLDFSHLCRLSLVITSVSECIEVFHRSPHLRVCILELQTQFPPHPAGEEDHTFQPSTPISLVQLHKLRIPISCYSVIFHHLLCPSLKDLILDIENRGNSEMALVADFLQKSKCSLESLAINEPYPSTDQIIPICEGVPTLQHLSLSSQWSQIEDILAPLAEFHSVDGKEEPRYLPALRSITLTTCYFPKWPNILDIFGAPPSRPPLGRQRQTLQSVIINGFIRPMAQMDWDTFSLETLEGVMWLREAGVNFKVYWDNLDVIRCAINRHGLGKSWKYSP
ncbi:hypothetical protein BDN70DRAFT_680258 [Pholiota conissans]|uniref:F-box domain-containing protein n=1 Tax=Pholiota conissans TaxID=109636 RepID=A0A9P6D647_9AGAR|nr:hypothetical protein BDN70DRAFT_680258 [Pholiota conissans]